MQAAGAVLCQDVLHHGAEGVRTDLSHQDNIIAQELQCEAGIGYASSGVYVGTFHVHQLSGDQHLIEFPTAPLRREHRGDIQTDMPCRNDLLHPVLLKQSGLSLPAAPIQLWYYSMPMISLLT